MSRFSIAVAASLSLVLAVPALAQPVAVTPLAAPDMFSTGGRDTGLPADLWRGASPQIVRTVLPLLAAKPLSPAGAALARRILATGAPAPAGVGDDPAVAGLRVTALIAQGDLAAGARILSRASGLERDSELSKAAAEAALLTRDDQRACAVAEALGVGRDDIYWLRLRAFCQARTGDARAARLTFDLAQAKARDVAYGRMMAARLDGGSGAPAVLRNGLDFALARALGLDLSLAKPAPAVAAALTATEPGAAIWVIEPGPGDIRAALIALGAGDIARAKQLRAGLTGAQSPVDVAILDAALAVAAGPADAGVLDPLLALASGDAKARARAQTAALYLVALGAPLSEAARGGFVAYPVAAGKAPPPRDFALDMAADAGRMGETGLVALWIAADAGAAGPTPGDRAKMIRALDRAGLKSDARAYALEGLLALR